MKKERAATLLERRLKEANQTIATQKQQLLDAQEMAASLYEQNAKKDTEITDLQAAVATLYEGSAK